MSRSIYFATAIVLILAMSAWAGIDFTNGGIRAGYVSPKDIDNTIGFGADVGFSTPVPNLSLNIEGNYWSKSWDETVLGSTWGMQLSDINIGVSGKYEFVAVPNKFLPYIGAGAGFHMLKSEVTISNVALSVNDNKVGVHAFGGFRVPFTPIVSAFVEARYTVVNPDYFGVYGGLNYNLIK